MFSSKNSVREILKKRYIISSFRHLLSYFYIQQGTVLWGWRGTEEKTRQFLRYFLHCFKCQGLWGMTLAMQKSLYKRLETWLMTLNTLERRVATTPLEPAGGRSPLPPAVSETCSPLGHFALWASVSPAPLSSARGAEGVPEKAAQVILRSRSARSKIRGQKVPAVRAEGRRGCSRSHRVGEINAPRTKRLTSRNKKCQEFCPNVGLSQKGGNLLTTI